MLFTFAWVALPFFAAADTGSTHEDVKSDAALLQRSEATATIVVGDRVTKAPWAGVPVALGALGSGALALIALRRRGVAGIAGVAAPRPSIPRSWLERGPPAF